MSLTRILIVDDHALLRSGLRMLIDAQPDLHVVGEAGTLADAIQAAPAADPDVITLDLSMPGSVGGAGIDRLLRAAPRARIVVLTMYDDPAYVRSAVALGAAGYVVKSAADTELISAIRAVAAGRMFIDAALRTSQPDTALANLRPAAHAPLVESLSDRERQVLAEVARGYTNQQIADSIGLSVKTVESYRARLMKKLNLKTRADLVRLALEMGALDQPGA